MPATQVHNAPVCLPDAHQSHTNADMMSWQGSQGGGYYQQQYSTQAWTGVCMVCGVRCVYGVRMGCVWGAYGVCVVCVWCVYGVRMAHDNTT